MEKAKVRLWKTKEGGKPEKQIFFSSTNRIQFILWDFFLLPRISDEKLCVILGCKRSILLFICAVIENMPFVFDRLCNMFSFVRIVLVLEFEIIIVSYLDFNFVILNLFNELNMTLKWYGTFHNNSNLYRFANSQNKSVFQYLLVHSKSRSIYQLASVSFIDPFIETSTDQHYRRRTLVIRQRVWAS